jgi:hypothetical protein
MGLQELQIARDSFCDGEEVYVLRRQYAGKQTVHRGKIIQKHATMASVSFPGRRGNSGKTEVIPYNRLSKTPPLDETIQKPVVAQNQQHPSVLRAVPTAFAQKLQESSTEPSARQANVPAAVPKQHEPTPLPSRAPAARATATSQPAPIAQGRKVDMDDSADDHEVTPHQTPDAIDPEIIAWMEMGSGLIDRLRSKRAQLKDESEQCAADAERLADLADAKLAEAKALDKQISGLENFGRMAESAL